MKTWILDSGITDYYDSFVGDWKHSNQAIDFFWVEMSLEEVWSMFQQEYYPYERQKLQLIDNPVDHNKFYFWVSRDLSLILQSFWAFSGSAMNDMKKKYIHFEPTEIRSLEELQNLCPGKKIND